MRSKSTLKWLWPIFVIAVTEGVSWGGTELSLHTEAEVKGGYDSNICVLRKSHPSPVKDECRREAAFFWGAGGLLAADAYFTDWFGVELEPELDYTGFYDSKYIIEPSVWLGTVFLPRSFLKIDIGASYRWFNFEEYPFARFHEIAPSASIAMSWRNHVFRLDYGWEMRILPERNESEWERKLGALWEYRPVKLLTLNAGLEWSHQEGDGQWIGLDEAIFPASMKFSYRWFYLMPAYVPGLVRFDRDGEYHFCHHVSFTAGFVPIKYIDISLSYGYEEIFAAGGPHGQEPAFSRHVGSLSVTFSWGGSLTVGKPAQGQEDLEPVSCKGGECTFRFKKKDAAEIYVAGSFSGWRGKQYRLDGPDSDGFWTLKVKLPPGRHRYIFICDGQPLVPENAESYEDDDLGSRNAVITVTGE
jgi:hypothetical protein